MTSDLSQTVRILASREAAIRKRSICFLDLGGVVGRHAAVLGEIGLDRIGWFEKLDADDEATVGRSLPIL